MFECRLVQGSLLRKIMEAINPLVTDVNIECTSSGLGIQAMDSASVCLVSMELGHEGFDTYRCDKNLILGVNQSNFLKIIKCGGADDGVTLRCQDNCDSIGIVIENADQDKTATFELKLMEIDADHLSLPDTEYDAVVRMPSHELQRIVRDLSQFHDTVNIGCSKEAIQFSTSADASSSQAKITLRPSASSDTKESEQVSLSVNEPVTMAFASRYVGLICKATPLSGVVSLSIKNNKPLLVEYKIGDIGHLRYYLAPKTEGDEGDVEE